MEMRETISNLQKVKPFRPFTIIMDAGLRVTVEGPNCCWLPPGQDVIVVQTRRGRYTLCLEAIKALREGDPDDDGGLGGMIADIDGGES